MTLLLAGDAASKLSVGDEVQVGDNIHKVLTANGASRTGVIFGLDP